MMSKKNKIEDSEQVEDSVESNGVEVTNLSSQELDVCGTKIAPGKTSVVPEFDPDKPLMAAYLNAKIISVI